MSELQDKVAVVTGGSRGIGRALVEGFAAAGAHVVIASRKLDICEAVAAEVSEKHGVRALAVGYHAGEWNDSDRLAQAVHDEFGRCDVLVNNAGLSPRYTDLPSIDEAYYDKVSSVNLKGPFRLSVLLAEQMKAGAGGSIINVSTIGSQRPGKDEIVYAAAKAGLNALTIGLAEAYGPTVRVNALLPGPVETEMASHWTEDIRQRAITGMPLDRLGQPEDFVGPALWLSTSASSFITGTLIRVDGGLYRQM